jgi:hypothetical protein
MIAGVALGDNSFDMMMWGDAAKCWETRYARASGSAGIRWVSNISTTETGGRSAKLAAGSVEFVNGFWLGSGSSGRQIKNASSKPTSGEYAQGDFVFNTAPSIDDKNTVIFGWLRLTTGSDHVPGVDWAVIRSLHDSP